MDCSDTIEISEFKTADEFINTPPEKFPRFITMDVNMPGINGFEATRQIIHNHPDTKIVIVSLNGGDDIRTKSIQCGAIGNILKDSIIPDLHKLMKETQLFENRKH